jgi:hypothetical protein
VTERAAAAAGETAAAAVESVVAGAEAAVAAAENRAEAAEVVRDAVIDSARRDELHSRMNDLSERCDRWQSELRSGMATLTDRLSLVEQRLTGLQESIPAPQPVVIVPASSTPDSLPEGETPPEGTPAVVVTPASAAPAVIAGAPEVPARRRKGTFL